MATIKLYRTETDYDYLPHKCMRCGVETEEFVERKFTWAPSWLFVLICFGLIGIIILVILRIVLAKHMKVDVPICSKHRGHWTRITVYILLGFVVMVAAIALPLSVPEGKNQAKDMAIMAMVGIWIAGLIGIAILSFMQIRTTQITEEFVTLAGVDRGFADDVKAIQERDAEERRERRRRRREEQRERDEDPYDFD